LYGERSWPLGMNAEESVDIDGPADLEYAEFLLTRAGRK
jgi:CMP-N-acetylneuraminic acid synthetase